jgi:hypothetical protein
MVSLFQILEDLAIAYCESLRESLTVRRKKGVGRLYLHNCRRPAGAATMELLNPGSLQVSEADG